MSDWSSDGCSSDLLQGREVGVLVEGDAVARRGEGCASGAGQGSGDVDDVVVTEREFHRELCSVGIGSDRARGGSAVGEAEQAAPRRLEEGRLADAVFRHEEDDGVVEVDGRVVVGRSEEHTSELQSLMRISYAVFCLKKKKTHNTTQQ